MSQLINLFVIAIKCTVVLLESAFVGSTASLAAILAVPFQELARKSPSLLNDKQLRHSMMALGQTFNVSSSTTRNLKALCVACMADHSARCERGVIQSLVFQGQQHRSASALQKCFEQHAKHANYQAAI